MSVRATPVEPFALVVFEATGTEGWDVLADLLGEPSDWIRVFYLQSHPHYLHRLPTVWLKRAYRHQQHESSLKDRSGITWRRRDCPVLEISLRTEATLDAIRAVRDKCSDAVVGAGTLRTPGDVPRCIDSGAPERLMNAVEISASHFFSISRVRPRRRDSPTEDTRCLNSSALRQPAA